MIFSHLHESIRNLNIVITDRQSVDLIYHLSFYLFKTVSHAFPPKIIVMTNILLDAVLLVLLGFMIPIAFESAVLKHDSKPFIQADLKHIMKIISTFIPPLT